jgi:hypothetical protein
MALPPQRVQDDLREQQLALMLRLERSLSRIGSDAHDEAGRCYELKTVTTAGVTTGRDVGLPYFDRLRHCYLIVARGGQTAYGFTITDVYFLAPPMMEDWMGRFETRIRQDMQLVEEAIAALQQAGFTGDLDRLRALCARGLTINNPKIPWAYIEGHGVRVDDPAAIHLRELADANPIPPRA